MAAESVEAFAVRVGIGQDAVDFLRALPGDVQEKVVRNFNPSGTKDGNVFGRLQAFARSLLQYSPSAAEYRQAAAVEQRQASPLAAAAPSGQFNLGSAAQYAQSLGLDEFGTSFLTQLPEDVQNTIMAEFDPRGTKDGNVFGRLLGFARAVWIQRLGLDGASKQDAQVMLRSQPEEVQAKVMSQFDASGTKDGNILARLQGFVRAVSNRISSSGGAVAGVGTFAGAGGLLVPGAAGGAATAAAVAAQAQAQAAAAAQAQAHAAAAAAGLSGYSMTAVAPGYAGYNPQLLQAAAAQQAALGGWATQAAAFPGTLAQSAALQVDPSITAAAVLQFAQRLNLDSSAVTFLQLLPQEIQTIVLNSFDPSGTKDGNVWGRLFGFIRSVWAQRLGLDMGTVNFLKSLPEDAQQVVISKFDPSRTKDGNIVARLESFARSVAGLGGPGVPGVGVATTARPMTPVSTVAAGGQFSAYAAPGGGAGPCATLEEFVLRWGLSAEANNFLRAMPEATQSVVLQSFRATGTKDGNVWGRLFGFVRSVWSQKLGLDMPAFTKLRSMPEETQINIMVTFAQELDPNAVQVKIQEVHEALLAAEGLTPADVQAAPVEAEAATAGVPNPEDEAAIGNFILRCNLSASAGTVEQFLRGLDPEVRSVVLSEFDPGGTKDGNVMGRLQGFAAAVEGRRKRLRATGQAWRGLRRGPY